VEHGGGWGHLPAPGHRLDPAAGFQEMHGRGMVQGVGIVKLIAHADHVGTPSDEKLELFSWELPSAKTVPTGMVFWLSMTLHSPTCGDTLTPTLMLDSRVLCDQQFNERMKQRFASLSGVVHKLEKTEVKGEFLL
jgi:hypothetical protein